MARTEENLRAIQNYGEQHPDFHSKEMKAYRSDKKRSVAKKMNHREDHLKSLQKKHGYSEEGTNRYKKFFGMK